MEEDRRRVLAEQTRGSNGHGHISRAKGLKQPSLKLPVSGLSCTHYLLRNEKESISAQISLLLLVPSEMSKNCNLKLLCIRV